MPLGRVTARQVLLFLSGPRTSTVTWRGKYKLLKNFFEFLAIRVTVDADQSEWLVL